MSPSIPLPAPVHKPAQCKRGGRLRQHWPGPYGAPVLVRHRSKVKRQFGGRHPAAGLLSTFGAAAHAAAGLLSTFGTAFGPAVFLAALLTFLAFLCWHTFPAWFGASNLGYSLMSWNRWSTAGAGKSAACVFP